MQKSLRTSQFGVQGPKVVAFGGGHGLSASLSALKLITRNITAIVTVADDGGSSGRLRTEFGILPPGDLRMALSALSDNAEWGQTWRDVFQHRFNSQGELDGHALGNIVLTALWQILGDPIAGLDWAGRLLNVKGRVLPMAAVPLEIEADVKTCNSALETVYGQVSVAMCEAPIRRIRIHPENPPVYAAALDAIRDAQWLIFGPGSWYTSVLPHLLIPDLYAAICASKARKLLVLNLIADTETSEMTAADLARTFVSYGPDLKIDAFLADAQSITDISALENLAADYGASLFTRNLAAPDAIAVHDSLYLAAAYREIFGKMKQDS
ncbi:gluconeogenesis factor YvcK family protein [Arcanobacterium hippocoleae]|nr:uridine diphosphate-N-acetylglucosamine-binding protein YvcK [Arcanobacterium hippocoleae]